MEAIVDDSIGAFERFLGELGELEACGCLGVVGKESGLEVRRKFVEGFLGVGDGSIRHPVIPHFRERDSSSLAHLV